MDVKVIIIKKKESHILIPAFLVNRTCRCLTREVFQLTTLVRAYSSSPVGDEPCLLKPCSFSLMFRARSHCVQGGAGQLFSKALPRDT